MATIYFTGKADAVAQESRATPAGPIVGDIFLLKVNGETIASYTADAVPTVAEVTAGLTTAWNASTNPYATLITATDQTTYVKLLSDVAGLPFTVTSSVTGVGTLVMSTPTASAGPNDWSTATNWSGGAVPVNNDVVIIKDVSNPIAWGLDQNAVTLTSLSISKTYTGRIGLDYTVLATSADALTTVSTKSEYRSQYLKIKVSTGGVRIGEHLGTGSPGGAGRIMLDLSTQDTTITVVSTAASSSDTFRPCIRLLGFGAQDLHVMSAPGGVGVAAEKPGEVSQFGSVLISDATNSTVVTTGTGFESAVWTQYGGNNIFRHLAGGTVTGLLIVGGILETLGDWIVTSGSVFGGTLYPNHENSGGNEFTNLTVDGGTVDFVDLGRIRNIGTINYKSGTIRANVDVLQATTILFGTAQQVVTCVVTRG